MILKTEHKANIKDWKAAINFTTIMSAKGYKMNVNSSNILKAIKKTGGTIDLRIDHIKMRYSIRRDRSLFNVPFNTVDKLRSTLKSMLYIKEALDCNPKHINVTVPDSPSMGVTYTLFPDNSVEVHELLTTTIFNVGRNSFTHLCKVDLQLSAPASEHSTDLNLDKLI